MATSERIALKTHGNIVRPHAAGNKTFQWALQSQLFGICHLEVYFEHAIL